MLLILNVLLLSVCVCQRKLDILDAHDDDDDMEDET